MDRTRPLWEVYVIDGLHSGRWAMLTKYHHATIDGAAGQLMLKILTDPDPDAPPPGDSPPWEAETLPSTGELLRRTAAQLARNPFKAMHVQARLVGKVADTAGVSSVSGAAGQAGQAGQRSRPSPDSAAPTGRASPCRQRRRPRPHRTSRSLATADSPCGQRLW
jgi:hypothetical protein